MKINAYSDPGHGWAAVPLTLLQRLDLLDRITPYSYLRGRFSYLEEDCDLSTFMDAARAAGLKIEFRQTVSGYRRSRIRGYESYSPARARALLISARALTRQGALVHALHHARQAWCWDDESHVRELVNDAAARGESFPDAATVREWIDQLAEHYGLIRPDSWGIARPLAAVV